jgi:OmpA-OmpF porin, OOP family
MMLTLRKAWLCFLCSLLLQPIVAQTSGKIATIQVHVSNTKGAARAGETVLFHGARTGKLFQVRCDAYGNGRLQLPPGDLYTIRLKTLTDTTQYSTIDIPALGKDEFFTAPFSIAIEYEPAKKFTLDHVYFDSGQPTLKPASFRELDEIFAYMQWRPEEQYEISGHTDNIGQDADNQRLSQRRADAVRGYLVKKGISPARIRAVGYGASRPVADNGNAEGRQLNRRTELLVLGE